MKRFLKSQYRIACLIGLLSLPLAPAWAQSLVPVSQLALTASEQQALIAALPQDTERMTTMTWQGNPLSITLSLGQEQRLIFSEPVQVDVNGQLTTAQLRVINDHQTVYLTALQHFKKTTRMYVTLKKSGQIIFLDLTTPASAKLNTKQIIQINVPAQAQQSDSSSTVQQNHVLEISPLSDTPLTSNLADDWVQGIRFVWQQLYAPSYLLSNQTEFFRSPLHSPFWVSGLFYSDAVFAHPLASWAKANLVITAVELRNPYPHRTALDITRDLCGHWRGAVLYPRTVLQSAGHPPMDSTTLFLVSNEPFHQAWGECDHGRA